MTDPKTCSPQAWSIASLYSSVLGDSQARGLAEYIDAALSGLRAENERLTAALKSASAQCGNVIFNCEQRPADNARHLSSWRGVKEFCDATLSIHERESK